MQQSSDRDRSPLAPNLSCSERDGAAGSLPPGQATALFASCGNRNRVIVRGELDLVSGDQIRARLVEALAASSHRLELDLSGLSFCDCAGLNVLLELRHRALSQGKTVTIQAASPAIDRLLDLTGAQKLFSPERSWSTEHTSFGAASLPSPKPGTSPGGAAQRGRHLSVRVGEPA
ncbi:anti-sigma factor antagonist [Streptomyces sp. SID1328]|uniref:STAS domain-containing protein n=1 Tax=Streptomyces sp. SID1328 TaxID=2690250 RepID=UPI00136851DC|nr:STAS domain-containing protein [Streptomyces sp. SID1328]MYV40856.1 anti-sigma factor antagonist [Streptomyces sp. SID1328]